jgi:hypothetical protein
MWTLEKAGDICDYQLIQDTDPRYSVEYKEVQLLGNPLIVTNLLGTVDWSQMLRELNKRIPEELEAKKPSDFLEFAKIFCDIVESIDKNAMKSFSIIQSDLEGTQLSQEHSNYLRDLYAEIKGTKAYQFAKELFQKDLESSEHTGDSPNDSNLILSTLLLITLLNLGCCNDACSIDSNNDLIIPISQSIASKLPGKFQFKLTGKLLYFIAESLLQQLKEVKDVDAKQFPVLKSEILAISRSLCSMSSLSEQTCCGKACKN